MWFARSYYSPFLTFMITLSFHCLSLWLAVKRWEHLEYVHAKSWEELVNNKVKVALPNPETSGHKFHPRYFKLRTEHTNMQWVCSRSSQLLDWPRVFPRAKASSQMQGTGPGYSTDWILGLTDQFPWQKMESFLELSCMVNFPSGHHCGSCGLCVWKHRLAWKITIGKPGSHWH